MGPGTSQAIGWLFTIVHVGLAGALLTVGLVRVRKASAAGGYLLAAAGGLEALTSCCTRGLHTYWRHVMDTWGYEAAHTMMTVELLVSMFATVLVGGLLIAGLATTARALTARRAS